MVSLTGPSDLLDEVVRLPATPVTTYEAVHVTRPGLGREEGPIVRILFLYCIKKYYLFNTIAYKIPLFLTHKPTRANFVDADGLP